MIKNINDFKSVFFIGIAGVGMSAIAQYLQGIGKDVAGSDRYFIEGEENETKTKLEVEGINCYLQNGEGITPATNLIVVSTAIEDTVPEVQKAKALNIPIIKRSELLAIIALSKKTIAIGGTSGKSTTSGMLFDILSFAGLQPSIISGAGLTSIIKEGKIGNAKVGTGDWLVIEADESDGSIVQYKPEIGLLLNVDKDHQEIDELMQLFTTFKNNSKVFAVNQHNKLASELSVNKEVDFSGEEQRGVKYCATNFLSPYRRNQILGNKNGVWVIDDYAHNPVKCAAAIASCQPVAKKVIAWFQPHGYRPTRFLRNDFVKEISEVLRPQDEIWMSEIFYAGGTALKDISANDLIKDIKALGKNAFFVEDRNNFVAEIKTHLTNDCVLLLMGARDPSLEKFSKSVYENL